MAEHKVGPTVYGIETEYSVMIRLPGDKIHEIVGQCHSADYELGLYEEPSDAGGSHLEAEQITAGLNDIGLVQTESGMLSNGGRLYMDPSGPEYNTPETATAAKAVEETFKGDRILQLVFDSLIKRGVIEGYQANRRIVDHNRSSRGIHLNNSTTLPESLSEEEYWQIAALQVAKGAMFGSGGLLVGENGRTEYHHSPRLSLTNTISASYSHYQLRPLVRSLFKPDVEGIKRVETVSGDALNFAWPLRASMVATNAMIKLIELNRHKGLPKLSSPVDAAHVVGRYGNGFMVAVLDKHNEQHAVYPSEVLSGFCEVALAVDTTEDFLDDESHQVLQEIIEVASILKTNPLSVATDVESIARYEAMQRKMAKEKINLDSEKMCSFDYYWDMIGGGLAEKLRHKGVAGWRGFDKIPDAIPSKKQIASPPSDTRAHLRGEMIRLYGPGNTSNWCVIEDGEGDNHFVPPNHTTFP